MILWTSHVALTVSDIECCLAYYRDHLGFSVLSDAPRQGKVIEKITGISGIHTRTVYLSVTPKYQLELFGFYHPTALRADESFVNPLGIKFWVLQNLDKNFPIESAEMLSDPYANRSANRNSEWFSADCGLSAHRDPDGILFYISKKVNIPNIIDCTVKKALVYPYIFVKDLDACIAFYCDVLGLKVWQPEPTSSFHVGMKKEPRKSKVRERSVILQSDRGICLKLVQVAQSEVLGEAVWRMEQIGYTHIAFAIINMKSYCARLRKLGVKFKSEPQRLGIGPHAGGECVYLDSPDGVVLEFIDSPLIQSLIRDDYKKTSPNFIAG